MKVLLLAIAVVALGTGIGQLAFDGMALRDVRDIESAFANGDGVRAELNHQELSDAFKTHDPAQMAEAVDRRLSDAPFDPFLLSVKAHAMFLSGSENLQISAKLFDQFVGGFLSIEAIQVFYPGVLLAFQLVPPDEFHASF